LKKADIKDYSGGSDNNLMDDNRVKFHSFYYKVYPYTVEYEIETTYFTSYIIPFWIPISREKCAVEKSSISIICPEDFSLRYKSFNYKGDPVITKEKKSNVYKWEVSDLPAILGEYASPDWEELTTFVRFSPDKFEIEGHTGEANSWSNLGKFQLDLNNGRDKLPDAIKQKVHQLTDNVTDAKEKIRILYEYMQKNTRYISIQLGIGGMQPFDASYVATKGYGDCKALTNYMYSLLKEVNIKSCYTQIKAGEGEQFFLPDFPSDQFDHIILCVPLQNDTMWLECTNQTMAAGYLGDFTADRYALAIDENGGKLVKTPKYGLKENVQVRSVKAKLIDDGTLAVHENGKYAAQKQDLIQAVINALSKDKVKEYLHDHFDFATYDINSFNYKENKSELPSVNEDLDISVSNYATITGKRLFIVPNVMTRTHRRLKEDEDRKYDIVLKSEYTDIDSVEIELPAGYELESKPQDVNVNNKFGKYSNSLKLSGNKLVYYRSMEQYSGRFPAKDYKDLVAFYESIYKADRNKVVLVKKE